MNNHCVITTINKPTKAVEKLHELFGGNLIIVGDNKTPKDWEYKDAQYILDLPSEGWYEGYAPRNHYARKNLGYMRAIKNKASLIYDTDDDNIPNKNWGVRTCSTEANESVSEGWFNVYEVFSDEHIWPRGFSLKHLNAYPVIGGHCRKDSSIQQGLADGESDVDAISRLVFGGGRTTFEMELSVCLQPKAWCPFNSQSTWWFPKAYPLMYLPVNASFRMTDIYRSFVAQRCLWEIGEGITFHSPSEVFQDRNEHDLLKDFADEVVGYLNNGTIIETLSNLNLKSGYENVCENLISCYQAIVDKKILPEMEMRSVKAWVKDYENITRDLG